MIKILSSIVGLALYLMAPRPSYAANINAPQVTPSKEVTARGVLSTSQAADITAAMNAPLLEVPYKLGESFNAGALLAKFDCTLQEAELAALMKRHQTHRIKYQNASELFQYGASGRLEVSLAKSEMQQVLAEADVMQMQLKDCEVYAPFSGHVTARHISAFETPQMGQKLYSLERARSSELSIIVPSKWMTWIEKGQALEFTVDATDETFNAKIIHIGTSVDPVSQTLEIIAKPIRTPKALTGMSGVARFEDAP